MEDSPSKQNLSIETNSEQLLKMLKEIITIRRFEIICDEYYK